MFLESVCFRSGGWVLGVGPTKKLQKVRNISFCGWVLCIIELYLTTTSTTKAKPNTTIECCRWRKSEL